MTLEMKHLDRQTQPLCYAFILCSVCREYVERLNLVLWNSMPIHHVLSLHDADFNFIILTPRNRVVLQKLVVAYPVK